MEFINNATKWLIEVSPRYMWLNIVGGVLLALFSLYLIHYKNGKLSKKVGKTFLFFSIFSILLNIVRLF